MHNIQFSYLYRDWSNYKNHGSVILPNPDNLRLAEFEAIIKAKLIDETWFVAKEWGVPDLHFDSWSEDDHGWHEFAGMEFTEEAATHNSLKA